jgi:uncharacterized protein
MKLLPELSSHQQQVIEATQAFVYEKLHGEASGHDWWHIYRVTQLTVTIAQAEGADLHVCVLAALLHDIADEKLNSSEAAGLQKVNDWLDQQAVDPTIKKHILAIISTMSFKGGNTGQQVMSLEGKVVQDADRLDAMGAIGIARTMAYSGFKGRPIHDPEMQPRENLTLAEYRNGQDTAIMHFYEKLLKLKDLMNTDYGKKLAKQRHQFMETYLETFYQEWQGEQ